MAAVAVAAVAVASHSPGAFRGGQVDPAGRRDGGAGPARARGQETGHSRAFCRNGGKQDSGVAFRVSSPGSTP